jgi:octaprenyl-diphosphate synthase
VTPTRERLAAQVTDLDQLPTAPRPLTEPLLELLKGDLERVNQAIDGHMQNPVVLIRQVAGHNVADGGNRLWPMLTLGCARLCGDRGERHIVFAAAIEFINTATSLQ